MQIPNIFTSFSPKFFLTIFLVKSKLSTAKKSKTTTFSLVFHPEKSTIFSENQSWIFGQKMKIWNSVCRPNQRRFWIFAPKISRIWLIDSKLEIEHRIQMSFWVTFKLCMYKWTPVLYLISIDFIVIHMHLIDASHWLYLLMIWHSNIFFKFRLEPKNDAFLMICCLGLAYCSIGWARTKKKLLT